MTTLPELPGESQVIGRVSRSGPNLTIRFLSDLHPEVEFVAHTIEARNVTSNQELESAITALIDAKQDVFVSWVDGGLCITSESGDELKVQAASFAVAAGPFSEEELRGVIDLIYSWYLSAHEFGNKQVAKVDRVKHLLNEQVRRISVKAQSHQGEGAAATLYSQQTAFIERILREIET